MTNAGDYYVYFLIDPRSSEVFYVGKGKGDRCFQHVKNYKRGFIDNPRKSKRIQEVYQSGHEVVLRIVKSNLSEGEAFAAEKQYINEFGLSRLTNISPGQLPEEEKARLWAKVKLLTVKTFDKWLLEKRRSVKEIELYHLVMNGLKELADGKYRSKIEVLRKVVT